jgi:hypothetical protein
MLSRIEETHPRMAVADKKIYPAVMAISALIILYTQTIQGIFLSLAAAIIMYTLTDSVEYTTMVLIFSIIYNVLFRTVRMIAPKEGFQAQHTPVAVQTRLEAVRKGAPLAPKVENITGVLEAPSILDNVPLNPAQELTSDAQPGKSIPASAKARVLVYPVQEGMLGGRCEGFQNVGPAPNPFLQNGPDKEAEATAMMGEGTAAPVGAGDMEGMDTAAPAF